MNVGIATFHSVYNYGAKLQQYALFKTVEKMGCTAYVLDIPDAVSRGMYHPQFKDLFNFSAGAKSYIRMLARDAVEIALKPFYPNLFRDFEQEHLRIGPLPGAPGAPIYTALICGSDQVWNPQVTQGDVRYFLDFHSPATQLRIAYAPSFGACDELSSAFLPDLAQLLKKIDILSCRERMGCDLVERLTQRTCPQIADPVMLLDNENWRQLARTPQRKVPSGKFVFCFDMQHTPLIWECGRKLAGKFGASVYYHEGHLGKKGWRSPIGLEEFLWLIQNAEAVVTNSFHGTLLSILFQKPLRVLYPTGRIERIKDLLDRLRLPHLLISTPEDADRFDLGNCETALPVIEAERAKGLKFLRAALAKAR